MLIEFIKELMGKSDLPEQKEKKEEVIYLANRSSKNKKIVRDGMEVPIYDIYNYSVGVPESDCVFLEETLKRRTTYLYFLKVAKDNGFNLINKDYHPLLSELSSTNINRGNKSKKIKIFGQVIMYQNKLFKPTSFDCYREFLYYSPSYFPVLALVNEEQISPSPYFFGQKHIIVFHLSAMESNVFVQVIMKYREGLFCFFIPIKMYITDPSHYDSDPTVGKPPGYYDFNYRIVWGDPASDLLNAEQYLRKSLGFVDFYKSENPIYEMKKEFSDAFTRYDAIYRDIISSLGIGEYKIDFKSEKEESEAMNEFMNLYKPSKKIFTIASGFEDNPEYWYVTF